MEGRWKLVVTHLGFAAIIYGLAALDGGEPPEVGSVLIALFAPAPMLWTLFAAAVLPPARFVAGMRDAGAELHVRDDRVGFFGLRRIRLSTSRGEWLVMSELHHRMPTLFVQAPGMREAQRPNGLLPRRAGRLAWETHIGDDASAREAPAWVRQPTTITVRPWSERKRAIVVLALLAGSALAVVVPVGLIATGRASTTWMRASMWAGIGVLAFVAAVGPASLAIARFQARFDALGRRAAGAALVVAAGCGAAALAAGALLIAVLHEAPTRPPLFGAAFGLLAAAIGWVVLASSSMPVRTLSSMGVLAALAAAWYQPTPWLGMMVAMLALLAMFQTWTNAPPTVAS